MCASHYKKKHDSPGQVCSSYSLLIPIKCPCIKQDLIKRSQHNIKIIYLSLTDTGLDTEGLRDLETELNHKCKPGLESSLSVDFRPNNKALDSNGVNNHC